MTRDEILAALRQVGDALHQQFKDEVGTHAARLEQLDHALGTANMAAGYLFDEEAREVDLANRILNDEAVSPIAGRTKKQYAVVARRSK